MRDEQIQELTLKLLSRLNPPRALTGQAQAIKDEATFLSKCISKVAPSYNLTDWFEEFEEAVLGNLETRRAIESGAANTKSQACFCKSKQRKRMAFKPGYN